MKKTLFRQLVFYMLLFLLLLSLSAFAVIHFLFDDYYYSAQTKLLIAAADQLTATYEARGIEAFIQESEDLSAQNGIQVQLFSSNAKVICGSNTSGTMQGMHGWLKDDNIGKAFVTMTGTSKSSMGQTTWLSYLDKTGDGHYLLAKISYNNMDSIIRLVETFFLYFGLCLVLIFFLFSFFFAKGMTSPLKQLNTIAQQMSHMNFALRYTGSRRDEIGQLGNTLNHLTEALENTIAQLKSELNKEKTLEKMRTQFTAQVSHELQTPLSIIKSYCEALIDRIYQGPEIDEVYALLLSEADRISRMVDDLLDLSQIEAGAFVVRKELLDFPLLVGSIYQKYRILSQSQSYQISLAVSWNRTIPIQGDPVRLEQAIRNVISNAVKHTPEGGRIALSLSGNNQAVQLHIFNEGSAIPDSDLPYIFDRFYTGRTLKAGAGIGLAVAKHIVSLHNGTIAAESSAHGVTFTISL